MATEFKGIPLIKLPKNIPSYNFLVDKFGEEILKEYNSIVKQDYKDNSNLKVLNFRDNLVKGSNSYAVVLMNKILSKQGLRTATPADAQRIINMDENSLKGVYTALGLVLRTENAPNEYSATQLAKQAKDRKYNFSNSNPLIFKPSDLELIADNTFRYGLGFNISEQATPFNASQLKSKNSGKNFKTTEDNGIPIFDKNGNRTNYAMNYGLHGLGLNENLDLVSGVVYLALSNDFGRIVVMNDGKGAR
jgi:hypothetical protein